MPNSLGSGPDDFSSSKGCGTNGGSGTSSSSKRSAGGGVEDALEAGAPDDAPKCPLRFAIYKDAPIHFAAHRGSHDCAASAGRSIASAAHASQSDRASSGPQAPNHGTTARAKTSDGAPAGPGWLASAVRPISARLGSLQPNASRSGCPSSWRKTDASASSAPHRRRARTSARAAVVPALDDRTPATIRRMASSRGFAAVQPCTAMGQNHPETSCARASRKARAM